MGRNLRLDVRWAPGNNDATGTYAKELACRVQKWKLRPLKKNMKERLFDNAYAPIGTFAVSRCPTASGNGANARSLSPLRLLGLLDVKRQHSSAGHSLRAALSAC